LSVGVRVALQQIVEQVAVGEPVDAPAALVELEGERQVALFGVHTAPPG